MYFSSENINIIFKKTKENLVRNKQNYKFGKYQLDSL